MTVPAPNPDKGDSTFPALPGQRDQRHQPGLTKSSFSAENLNYQVVSPGARVRPCTIQMNDRANPSTMEDKAEPRYNAVLPVRVFGVDADDHAFSQKATTVNISRHGAEISGLDEHLNPGDVIGVHVGGGKAHCEVIWVTRAGHRPQIEVGIQLARGQACPWLDELEKQIASGALPSPRALLEPKDRRRFTRHRISFPIEIQDDKGAYVSMKTQTEDMSGRGCYIRMMLPFPVGQCLQITFWLNSQRTQTAARVATCDGGVGMGIEFTGLDEAEQKELQGQIEGIAGESGEVTLTAEMTDGDSSIIRGV